MNLPDASTVFEFVRSYPRMTCAQIAAELDAPSVVVSASLRALRSAGKLRSSGNTKATLWRPAPNWR